MYEDCPSYKLFYTYDANGFLSGIKRILANGTTENFGVHCNIFGDVISVYYDDGFLAATYSYDSWGKLLSVKDTTGADISSDNDIWTQNSIRYRGYVYDEETQLYYLQSRYYDPETCRFINADDYDIITASPTALSDKNLYAYCDSNPIIRADDEGDFWHIVAGAAIGGLFELGNQLLLGEEVNFSKIGVATLSGGLSATMGVAGGVIVSGLTNVVLDYMSGERNGKKLIISGVVGMGTSILGAGVSDVAERIGGKVATKMLSNKMSKGKLKSTVTKLVPKIKGAERNKIKNISYLTNNYSTIGRQYFMSSQIGKTLSASIGQMTEGFSGVGISYLRMRYFSI